MKYLVFSLSRKFILDKEEEKNKVLCDEWNYFEGRRQHFKKMIDVIYDADSEFRKSHPIEPLTAIELTKLDVILKKEEKDKDKLRMAKVIK